MRSQENTINQTGRTIRLMLTLVGFILMISAAAQAQTYHVTNTNDNGPGSLREAIIQSNQTDPASPNVIDFQIMPAGGVKTIGLQSQLPDITTSVVIDGTTQPGYAGAPVIELDGSNAGNGATALKISAGNSTVKGLVINRFSGYGIELQGIGQNVIVGNYFGLDSAGTTSLPIGGASLIIYTSGNTIGGTTPAERNVISGVINSGIVLSGNNATGNLVKGNYIGTDATGNAVIGNVNGIYFDNAAGNTVGGTTPGERNIISGNNNAGILMDGPGTSNNIVTGNYIGTKTDGASNLSNSGPGVYLFSGPHSNVIGGTHPGEGNVIAFQFREVALESDAGNNNSIRGNSIFSSGQMAIDLGNDAVTANESGDADTGANDLQNYPVIASAVAGSGNVDITGTLNSTANKDFVIDFYSNATLNGQGNGEARKFLTAVYVSTDGSGNANFVAGVPVANLMGTLITATATDLTNSIPNNTSELSVPAQVTGLNGVLQFGAPTYSVNENGGTATITVTRSGGSLGALSIAYATNDGTAKQPGDYTSNSGSLLWADGDTSDKTFSVAVIDDSISDQNETISLALSNPSGGATLGAQSTAVLTIVDNELPPNPADLVVTNTNDSGPGSLRQAITTANGIVGTDTISFNIQPAGVHTIVPLSALPFVTDAVIIDATTQPGFAGTPVIELNGASAGQNFVSGLVVKADSSTIKGFVINRFSYAGIFLASSNNTVAGNFIGIDVTGNAKLVGNVSLANNTGIGISGGNSNNNLIGGTTASARNVISNNPIDIDICCQGMQTGNKIVGNYIGTNAGGTTSLGVGSTGVRIDTAPNTIVGGITPAERNVISGNTIGISLSDNIAGTVIQGNYIGTKADGATALGNSYSGIYSVYGVTGATIGGTASGASNVIAFNGIGNAGNGGVSISFGLPFTPGKSITVSQNSIYSNNGLGIDLGSNGVTTNDAGDGDTGPNALQNYPVLTSVTTNGGNTIVQGTLDSEASKSHHIELFSNNTCSSSGFGQGQYFVAATDVATDASGNAGFTFTIPTASITGAVFTATATNANNSTSEFSACASAAAVNPGVIQFGANSSFVNENAGNAVVTVTRTGGSTGTVTVAYATANGGGGATSPADYTAASGTLTFLDGETSKNISVSIIDDSISEPQKFFSVSLSNPTGGATLGNQGSIQVSILDNDAPTFSITDVQVNEGNAGTTDASFTVSLNRPYFADANVDFATLAGTATSGTDFQPTNGTLTFVKGETIKTVIVKINGDTLQEPDETFSVKLSNNNNVAVSKSSGAGAILDDDAGQPQPTTQFDAATYTVSEGAHYKQINVSRTGDVSAPASVDYATSDMSANQRTDYNIMLGTLRFAAGENNKTLTLLLTDDSFVEGDESLTLTLSNPQGVTLGAQSVSQITITDNDSNQNAPNAIDDTANFVRQNYHDFLNREPDPGGFQGWQDILNQCAPGDVKCDRIEVSSAFYRSTEFHDRGYFIYRFYSASLGKVPQYMEFMRDIQKVSGFLDAQQQEAAKVQFIEEFMARPAFQQKYGQLQNPGTYVDAILSTSGVTLPQRDQIVQQLQGNQITRGQALRQIIESSEVDQKFYDESFVIMQYFGYLRRDADVLYLQWIQTLKQTGDYRIMVNGFMNSLEYRQRFGQ